MDATVRQDGQQAQQAPPPPAYDASKPPQYPPAQYPQGGQAPYPAQAGAYPAQAGAYQVQAGYPAGYGQPGQPTIIVQQGQQHPQTVVVQMPALGHGPVMMICPNCHAQMTTIVDSSISSGGWIAAAILCLFGCWLCVWIPLVMDSNKEIKHVCPNCHTCVGHAHHH